MNEIKLAYLAGIIDGEGYIGIKRCLTQKNSVSPVYSEKLCVCMSDEKILLILKKTFGGQIYERKFNNKKIKTNLIGYSWEISDKKAYDALKILSPYIQIKKKQLLLVLKLRKSKLKKSKLKKNNRITDTENKYRELLYNKIKNIHGNHHD